MRHPVLACDRALLLASPARSGAVHPLGDIGSHEIIAAKPGTILRVWPQVGGSVDKAKAYRIIYRSTGMNGEPIAVSGAILFPTGPTPRVKRDVVAWAHPTTGVVEKCAPTLLPDLSGTIAGIDEMLDRGFVIAATDYAGLGGEGIHPYLIGVSEARAVLNSVRAARQLPDAAAGPFRGMGSFAGRPCGAVHRRAGGELCAGAAARRRRRSRTGNLSWRAIPRR